MAYVPLRVDVARWPHVERFIRHSLETMFFHDVHTMLRLPMKEKGLRAGCNFALTHTLLAAVAGISTSLFRPGKVEPYGGAFQGVLVDWYPWDLEAQPPAQDDRRRLARALYEEFRGPLTHHMGLSVGKTKTGSAIIDRGYAIKIKRRTRPIGGGFLEKELELLERSDRWPFPSFFQGTMLDRKDAKVLKVERFYWGIRQMVVRLTQDQGRMNNAEAFLEKVEKKSKA